MGCQYTKSLSPLQQHMRACITIIDRYRSFMRQNDALRIQHYATMENLAMLGRILHHAFSKSFTSINASAKVIAKNADFLAYSECFFANDPKPNTTRPRYLFHLNEVVKEAMPITSNEDPNTIRKLQLLLSTIQVQSQHS